MMGMVSYYPENYILDNAEKEFKQEIERIRNYLNYPRGNPIVFTNAFKAPPPANIRISVGSSSRGPYASYVQFYNENPPNLIQRFLVKKIFGINIERF